MDALAAVTAVAAARAVAATREAVVRRDTPGAAVTPRASDEAELSPAGRLVEALLTSQPEAAPAGMAAQPLLAAPPDPGAQAQLARALQRGLQQSGLFYESHQAAWVQGEHALPDLLQEPQGRLPALPVLVAGALALPDAGSTPQHATKLEGHPVWPAEVDPRAGVLVQQQLEALDTRVVPWHGQVWPGQEAEWTVAAHIDPDQSGSGEPPQSWTSRLTLDLPALGSIDAELRWSSAQCSLQLSAPPARLPQLRAALPMLAQALSAAGIRADRIQVSAQRSTGDG